MGEFAGADISSCCSAVNLIVQGLAGRGGRMAWATKDLCLDGFFFNAGVLVLLASLVKKVFVAPNNIPGTLSTSSTLVFFDSIRTVSSTAPPVIVVSRGFETSGPINKRKMRAKCGVRESPLLCSYGSQHQGRG